MQNKLAAYLLSARSALRMDAKTVASLNRISDKTLSRLEQTAEANEPTVEMLMSFYRRYGIEFVVDDGGQITSMKIGDGLREGTIVFGRRASEGSDFYAFPGAMRYVVHLILKPTLVDRHKGGQDAYRFSVPSDSENLFSKLIVEWIAEHGPLTIINAKNETKEFNEKFTAGELKEFLAS